jgi:hypothetical protein
MSSEKFGMLGNPISDCPAPTLRPGRRAALHKLIHVKLVPNKRTKNAHGAVLRPVGATDALSP